MKSQWLHRSLVNMPLCFTLATNETVFDREIRRLKVPASDRPKFLGGVRRGGEVHKLQTGDGGYVAIVTVLTGRPGVQVASTLVHEAVHIWQWAMELLGEDKPSDEFMAYVIQNISEELFNEYMRQTT